MSAEVENGAFFHKLTIPQPAVPLVSLRAVRGDAHQVGEEPPAGVAVEAVEEGVRAAEGPRGPDVGMDDKAGNIAGLETAAKAADPGIAKAVISETGFE